VSRRSFFRYFTTKDHVLAHSIIKYGDVLVSAVGASPAESSASEVVHDAVLAGIRFATSEPRTRQIIEITSQNLSARQAHRSRMVEVEIRLCTAFAARTRNETKDALSSYFVRGIENNCEIPSNCNVIADQLSPSTTVSCAASFTDFQWVTFHMDEKSACRPSGGRALFPRESLMNRRCPFGLTNELLLSVDSSQQDWGLCSSIAKASK